MFGLIVTYTHQTQCRANVYKDNDECNCTTLEVCRSCGGNDEAGHESSCDYNGTLASLDDCR